MTEITIFFKGVAIGWIGSYLGFQVAEVLRQVINEWL